MLYICPQFKKTKNLQIYKKREIMNTNMKSLRENYEKNVRNLKFLRRANGNIWSKGRKNASI